MHIDTQFSVFLVNKPGVLAQVTKSIAKAHVNLMAMTLVDSSEHGVLRFVCDEPQKVRAVLKTKNDYWTETEVLVMQLQNKPGVLAAVAEELADAHVNISYAYTSGGGPGGKTTCVFKVADIKKASKLLDKYNGTDKDGHDRGGGQIRPARGSRR
jgi:hypothetical protein